MSRHEAQAGEPPLWPEAGPKLPNAAVAELRAAFQQLIQQESLGDDQGPLALFESLYLPMAGWIAAHHRGQPLLLGINGGQGSGKSTLCKILQILLQQGFDKRVVVISIDDLYLPRADRQRLASRVHPLLATRGVPGTHDVTLAQRILARLKQGQAEPMEIPLFDKARDDRVDPAHWQTLQGPVDIILFEGWCVGAVAQPESALERPINSLESSEDAGKQWRRFVNAQLAGPYRDLFSLIDILFMLKVPAMENVFEWRLLQENKLRQSLQGRADAGSQLMSEQQLNRFIMHYERITRASLGEMPARADVVLQLNRQHQVCSVTMNGA